MVKVHQSTFIEMDDEKFEKIVNSPNFTIYRYEVLLEIAEHTFPLNNRLIYKIKSRLINLRKDKNK